jgi:hypothetical protein
MDKNNQDVFYAYTDKNGHFYLVVYSIPKVSNTRPRPEAVWHGFSI